MGKAESAAGPSPPRPTVCWHPGQSAMPVSCGRCLCAQYTSQPSQRGIHFLRYIIAGGQVANQCGRITAVIKPCSEIEGTGPACRVRTDERLLGIRPSDGPCPPPRGILPKVEEPKPVTAVGVPARKTSPFGPLGDADLPGTERDRFVQSPVDRFFALCIGRSGPPT